MKKTVLALLYSFYIIKCEYAFINQIQDESMENALKDMIKQIEKVNFTNAIQQKKYNKISIVNISKLNYYFMVLFLYQLHIADAKINKFLFNIAIKRKKSFNNSLTPLLLDILKNPNSNQYNEPIFELLPLVIGPGLTLLDFIKYTNESKENITNYYNSLLQDMSNIYIGKQKTSIDTFFQNRISGQKEALMNQTDQQKALFYAQQTYSIMNKHKLTININLKNIVHEVINKEKMFFDREFFNQTKSKLEQLNKKITQKITSFKNNVSSYKTFLYDYNFHADIVTLLRIALTDTDNFQDSIIELLKNISLYLDTVKDCALLDSMEERTLILHYKDTLLRFIQAFVNQTKKKN